MSEPYPKEKQLARGQRRYRRRVASAKQWQALFEAKRGPCRVCTDAGTNGHGVPALLALHHLVSRQDGGDDVASNLVPLCFDHHDEVTRRLPEPCFALLATLRDDEYAYVLTKGGEDYFERVYGIEYQR